MTSALAGLRAALVCPYSWSHPGGVQAHVAGLARALRARGLEVEIVAPADGPVDVPGFVPVGRSVPIPDNRSVQRVALSPGAIARCVRIARSARYDLIHLHEPMIPWTCFSILVTARAPLVGTFHMYADSPRWYTVFGPLARRALARLAARIAVSEAARRHVERVCPGRYVVIPNGVDVPPRRTPAEKGSRARIVFVGRPERRKGLPVLLEAFSRLSGEPELELVGVDPSDVPALPRVTALGRVTEEEKLRRLAAADLLCAPSLGGESFGVVLVEGMAAGLPVVASDIPGYRDLVRPSWGRLVPPGDPGALATALGELLRDETLRARMGEAARREALRYDWPRVAERILAVYADALGVGGVGGAGQGGVVAEATAGR